eukprot:GILK01015727.1.p1 GENE.GILK01015727.1~~GILK01015727.1.p1  ORF type:complete len:259 (+),score=17.20 GILK01015727.1:48-824(+)
MLREASGLEANLRERQRLAHENGFLGLDVPHVRQSRHWDCGLACLKMVFPVFSTIMFESVLMDQMACSTSIWSIDLLHMLVRAGVSCWMSTITMGACSDYQNETFYKEDFDAESRRVNELFRDAKALRLSIVKRSIPFSELHRFLASEQGVVIALVDDRYLNCSTCPLSSLSSAKLARRMFHHIAGDTGSYLGHFIVVCGITATGEIVYKNPAVNEERCILTVADFDKARTSFGTDEDLIFVSSNASQLQSVDHDDIR